MDYLELDNSEIQALTELGGGLDFGRPLNTPAKPPNRPSRRHRHVEATYLLRLESPLLEPLDVASALGLPHVPQLETGSGEDGEARFCRLSQSNVESLESWADINCPGKKFTKIRLGIAHKDSLELPVLGHDPTLPHHRPSSSSSSPTRTEQVSEYPVQYFVYGTLASPERLSRLFSLPVSQLPILERASLPNGRIRTWANKYRALVDCPGGKVDGVSFSVASADQEDALRVYEGDSYEIVRATFNVNGRETDGRTFRFAGFNDELDD